MKETFTICSIPPFWRWAVCPESECSPGVGFYTERGARSFFDEAKRALPWAAVYLLKRHYFQGLEVIEYYPPHPNAALHYERP